jgi:hypothetical protein
MSGRFPVLCHSNRLRSVGEVCQSHHYTLQFLFDADGDYDRPGRLSDTPAKALYSDRHRSFHGCLWSHDILSWRT